MKNAFLNSTVALLLLAVFTSINVNAASLRFFENSAPPQLNCVVTIPANWQSQIVRQDFENEAIFSMKNETGTAFLFSVTKVTGDQWMSLKDQVKDYTIIENKDGFITFLQKTDVQKIKGNNNAQYQQALGQVDGIISSIHLN